MKDRDTFLKDVVMGLRSTPKRLASKYFYDERGSQLFDEITELPEYYPTRTEVGILQTYADQIAAAVGPDKAVIEYGSGSGLKTRLLLEMLEAPRSYVPVEISGAFLEASAAQLRDEFPSVDITPIHADYTRPFDLPSGLEKDRMVFFPGSTIGNFTVLESQNFLAQIARQVGRGGGLLIGVDLKKDPAVLHAAYNDSKGVTAEFNRNVLLRINDRLDGDFDVSAFYHHACYAPAEGRIEMHLVSARAQTVRLSDHTFEFEEGETVLTEYSHKYSPSQFDTLAQRAGFERKAFWTDADRYFGVFYFEVTG